MKYCPVCNNPIAESMWIEPCNICGVTSWRLLEKPRPPAPVFDREKLLAELELLKDLNKPWSGKYEQQFDNIVAYLSYKLHGKAPST